VLGDPSVAAELAPERHSPPPIELDQFTGCAVVTACPEYPTPNIDVRRKADSGRRVSACPSAHCFAVREFIPITFFEEIVMRKTRIVLAVAAVIFAAAAPVTRFVVLPQLRQVPATLDISLAYSGTVDLLNPQALATGDMAHAFLRDMPVTASQRVKVTSVTGKTAVLSDVVGVAGPDGKPLLASSYTWAVNRVSLSDEPAPGGTAAQAHTGLVIGFPLQPAAVDYPFWDTATRTTVAAHFVDTERVGGRDAYKYTVHAAGGVQDQPTLAALPTSLPKITLVGLVTTAPGRQPDAAADALPDTVPIEYSAVTNSAFWVDKSTGYMLEVAQDQTITAELAGSAGPEPVAPVLHMTLRTTPNSVNTNVHNASTAAFQLSLISTIAPIAFLVVAVLLGVTAYISGRRRKAVDN
jgi:hypothetical protein